MILLIIVFVPFSASVGISHFFIIFPLELTNAVFMLVPPKSTPIMFCIFICLYKTLQPLPALQSLLLRLLNIQIRQISQALGLFQCGSASHCLAEHNAGKNCKRRLVFLVLKVFFSALMPYHTAHYHAYLLCF